MSAVRHAGETCVTARIDGLDFERPVPQGDTCVVESYAYEAGRTSVEVGIHALWEAPRTGDREQTTDAYVTSVAVDGSGPPAAVPGSIVGDSRCGRLRRDAFENAPAERPSKRRDGFEGDVDGPGDVVPGLRR